MEYARDAICLNRHNHQHESSEAPLAELIYSDGAIREENIWRVPTPVLGSNHVYKYSFVYIVARDRLIGYDNERGKGDHRHFHGVERSYRFRGLIELLADFRGDVERERS